jgi:ABC-type glycerol-3-phosphate transport system permease component
MKSDNVARGSHAEHQVRANALLRTTALLAVAVLMLYPLLWLVGASFKTNTEIFTEVGFWPGRLDFSGLRQGLAHQHRVHLRDLLPQLVPDRVSAHRGHGGELHVSWWPMRLRASSSGESKWSCSA